MRIQCSTLFNITESGIIGYYKQNFFYKDKDGNTLYDQELWTIARNTQRNFETIIQLISLRAQVSNISSPIQRKNTWKFNFILESLGAYGDNFEILLNDVNGVPMIALPNSINDIVLNPYGNRKNIWFKELD